MFISTQDLEVDRRIRRGEVRNCEIAEPVTGGRQHTSFREFPKTFFGGSGHAPERFKARQPMGVSALSARLDPRLRPSLTASMPRSSFLISVSDIKPTPRERGAFRTL
jgi:hypothetical protein